MTIGEAKKDVQRPKQAMVTKKDEGKPTVLDGTCRQPSDILNLDAALWRGDCESFLAGIPEEPLFDLVVTSPPYNIGKSYEKKDDLAKYLEWQERVIDLLIPRLKDTGSLCWQVGNFVDNGQIAPLDIEFAPIFKKHGLQLRNRVIWHFGHGLHTKRRFSGRYEVVMWYTKTDTYHFDLNAVRVPAKYPGKKHFKGPRKGEVSGNGQDIGAALMEVNKVFHCASPGGLERELCVWS